jgi:hypothetical protein
MMKVRLVAESFNFHVNKLNRRLCTLILV